MQKEIIKLLFILNLITIMSAGPMQKWTFEIIEVKTYTSDPNVIDLAGEVVRLRRGVYGFSGYWNLKVDLYDDTLISATAERSKYRDGPYSKIPMGVDNETLTNAMNKFYKVHAQPVIRTCAPNAPIIEDTFEAPLTARDIEGKNCEIQTDNLPNIMMEGYYKVRTTIYSPNYTGYAEGLFLVENKND